MHDDVFGLGSAPTVAPTLYQYNWRKPFFAAPQFLASYEIIYKDIEIMIFISLSQIDISTNLESALLPVIT
ncbi:hypothetical protein [Pleionea mediterranea]|uniref:hypothetical protein n=1 Tax=Pleionea mediterranea TaxID=523701 RepID=UPI0011B2605F|nr:hypothetical protein [Pleionea mediterranea]